MSIKTLKTTFLAGGWLVLLSIVAQAQTTAFTYQGKLTDSGNPANGNYDFQFALFDSLSNGTQIGSTLTRSAVSASGGIFTVQLDFGVNAFPGADRFLLISVRTAGGGTFTTLAPRQQISSTPYAIRSLSATAADSLSNSCVSCVQDSQINSVAGSKVTGTIPVAGVPAGSGNYIQNTSSQQANANFNIGGSGFLAGNFGVGTTTPQSPLAVQTGTGYGFTHTNGTVSVGSFVDSTAGWFGTRSNHALKFFTNNAASSMTITTNGFVGVGTPSPASKLDITGASGRTLIGDPGCDPGYGGIGFGATLANCANYSLIGNGTHTLVSRPAGGGIFFREANTDQMIITSGGNVGIGTTTPNAKLQVAGNVTQSQGFGGLVKAMVYVNGDGTILRCYNGTTGSSSGNCGFTVTRGVNPSGVYVVDFGFQVQDRFFLTTTISNDAAYSNISTNTFTVNQLLMATYDANHNLSDRPFMIIVY